MHILTVVKPSVPLTKLQGFKGKPQLGEYVWRYVPGGPPARVMADGFERPNGLALSADQQTMYVSDTGLASGADDQVDNVYIRAVRIHKEELFKGNLLGGRLKSARHQPFLTKRNLQRDSKAKEGFKKGKNLLYIISMHQYFSVSRGLLCPACRRLMGMLFYCCCSIWVQAQADK